MEVIYIILTGIFTLSGVALGHHLTSRQQMKTRQVEYARESLRNIQDIAGKMEILALNIMFLLVGAQIMPSEEQKETMKDNINDKINQINNYLMNNPMSPGITNKPLDDTLTTVFANFSNLCFTFGVNTPTLLGEQLPEGLDMDLLKKVQLAVSTNDFDTICGLIAPDQSTQAVLEATKALAQSIEKLHKEIENASVGNQR